MGLSRTELLLVLRARDEASRTLHAVGRSMRGMDKDALAAANAQIERGRAMTSVGVGLVAIGAAGFYALEKAGKGAREYDKSARLAFTQTDKVATSVAQLKKVGLEVARTLPVAFDQIQPAFYDIFSSIDTNMSGATKLIKQFAKDSIAGGTDMETATRSNLQVLNAYSVSVKHASQVSDFFFQLVRKGVGNYQEMTAAVGKGIPSAQRAGQSYQELGGMIAFLTRQGVAVGRAGTVAARALDAMSNPTTVKRLERMGVTVKNSKGEYRKMSQIVYDLGKKLKGATGPERAKALKDLFAGSGGTIQARRFYDLVFKNMDKYQARVKDMKNTKGAAGVAFNIMKDSDAAKVQRFQNNLKALQTEMGDIYNTIRSKIVVGLAILLNKIGDLNPNVKKAIVYFTLFASTVAVLTGVALIAIGLFTMMSAGLALIGIGFLPLIGIIAGVVAAIAIFAVGAYLIYKHWDGVKAFFADLWYYIKRTADAAFKIIWKILTAPFTGLIDIIANVMHSVAGMLKVLGRVPGFGWVGDLGTKIEKAATKMDHLSTKVKNFPKGKINLDTKDLDKAVHYAHTTDASLRILLGLPPLKIKPDLSGLLTAKIKLRNLKTGLEDIGLTKAKPKVDFSNLSTAKLETLKSKKALQEFYGVSSKGTSIKIKSEEIKVAKQLSKDVLGLLKLFPGAGGKGATAAGAAIGQGFKVGLGSMFDQVSAAGARLGAIAIAAAKKAASVASPSKATIAIGRFIGSGLVKGMLGTADDVAAASKTLIDLILKALKAGSISKASSKAAIDITKAYTKRIAIIAKAKDKLNAKISEYKDAAKNIADDFKSFGALTNIQDVFGGTGSLSAADLQKGLQDKLAAITDYQNKLTALSARGLNKDLYAQLVAAGVEGGKGYVDALSASTPQQLTAINDLNKQINTQATSIGNRAADAMFAAGSSSAAGYYAGLIADRTKLIAAANALADRLIAAIKKRLGIRSPSAIFHGIGSNLSLALAEGLKSQMGEVTKAAGALSDAVTFNPNAISHANANAAFNRAAPPVDWQSHGPRVHQEITVNTQEIDPRKHAEELGFMLANRMA